MDEQNGNTKPSYINTPYQEIFIPIQDHFLTGFSTKRRDGGMKRCPCDMLAICAARPNSLSVVCQTNGPSVAVYLKPKRMQKPCQLLPSTMLRYAFSSKITSLGTSTDVRVCR